jgi:NO-binding membrane sensor protein with MHYT domain
MKIIYFLIPILASFLIAFLTSRLCFKLYFTIRDDSQDQHKLTIDQLKKWQVFAISMLAYSLPNDVYRFWQKGRISIALTVAVAVSLTILIFIYYLKHSYKEYKNTKI